MAQWQRNTPWRQGHILTAESAKALGIAHPRSPDDTIVIVISHDCDLAQPPENEPNCEIVIARTIGNADGNLAAAKNPRRLHLPFTAGAVSVLADLDVLDKTTIAKDRLADHLPTENVRLNADERATLQSWLSARYRRAAFADKFDRRLKQGKGKFFDKLVYSVADDPEVALAAATEAANALKELFAKTYCENGKWDGIELIDCWPTSADAITVHQARLLKQWHFEYLSLREDPQGDIIELP